MLNTVNVIEFCSGTIMSIRSFPDNIEGNKQAEALFWETASKNGAK